MKRILSTVMILFCIENLSAFPSFKSPFAYDGSPEKNDILKPFYKDARFSRFFYKKIQSEDSFLAEARFCITHKRNWTPKYVAELKSLKSLSKMPDALQYPARCYNVMEYINSEQGTKWRNVLKNTNDLNHATARCHPETTVKKGIPVDISSFILIPPGCSVFMEPVFTELEQAIEKEYNSQENQALDDEWDILDKDEIKKIIAEANESPLFALTSSCKNNLIAGKAGTECAKLVSVVKGAIANRNFTPMMYSSSIVPVKIEPSNDIVHALSICETNIDQPECRAFLNNLLSTWRAIDPKNQKDIVPAPVLYLQQNPHILEKLLSTAELKQEIAYFNFTEYTTAEDVFLHLYSIACALDPSYRMRLSQKDRTHFEKEIAASNSKIAKALKDKLTNFSKTITEKFGETSNIGKTISQTIDVKNPAEEYLIPASIELYIENFRALQSIQVNAKNNTPSMLADLVQGPRPLYPTKIPKGASININYNAIYAVVSKICISILGPEYLKAEEAIHNATSTEDQEKLLKELTEMSESFDGQNSTKAPKAYRGIPANEYNKLRQLAFALLTNMHILLLDEHLRAHNQNEQNQFSQIAQQIKDALPKQFKFLTEYFFALQDQKYDALSMQFIANDYSEAFLDPVYPTSLEALVIDRPTLLDGQGTNMYSLYTSYILASVQGVLELNNTQLVMENRSLGGRLKGSVAAMYGADIERGIQTVVSGAIKTTLDLLPIPKPPIVTGAIATGLSMALVAGPSLIYKSIHNSCAFNKKKCPKEFVQKMGMERTLLIRITEFLAAMNMSLKIFIRDENPNQVDENEKERTYSRLMPSLYLLENDQLARERRAPVVHAKDLPSLINALIDRTIQYYQSLTSSEPPSREIDTGDL
jgi:hypothetical protein